MYVNFIYLSSSFSGACNQEVIDDDAGVRSRRDIGELFK